MGEQMNALLQTGHLPGCPYRYQSSLGEAREGCDRCKRWVYIAAIGIFLIGAYIELVGSSVTHSFSLGSDGWHMASDSVGYIIGLVGSSTVFLHRWFRASEETITRIQHILELLMAGFLIATGGFVLVTAGRTLFNGNPPPLERNILLIIIASGGLVINLLFLWIFWRLGISHAHPGETSHHHHSCDHHQPKKKRDNLLWGNFVHTAADTFSSVAVLMNAVLARYLSNPSFRYLDILIAISIALYLVHEGVKIIRIRH